MRRSPTAATCDYCARLACRAFNNENARRQRVVELLSNFLDVKLAVEAGLLPSRGMDGSYLHTVKYKSRGLHQSLQLPILIVEVWFYCAEGCTLVDGDAAMMIVQPACVLQVHRALCDALLFPWCLLLLADPAHCLCTCVTGEE